MLAGPFRAQARVSPPSRPKSHSLCLFFAFPFPPRRCSLASMRGHTSSHRRWRCQNHSVKNWRLASNVFLRRHTYASFDTVSCHPTSEFEHAQIDSAPLISASNWVRGAWHEHEQALHTASFPRAVGGARVACRALWKPSTGRQFTLSVPSFLSFGKAIPRQDLGRGLQRARLRLCCAMQGQSFVRTIALRCNTTWRAIQGLPRVATVECERTVFALNHVWRV